MEDRKSANRRLQCQLLRQELNQADQTCVQIMGFLITVTVVGGAAFNNTLPPFAGWMISPVWLMGFWYLTEKRFVIRRNATYIRLQIEAQEPGLEWERFLATMTPGERRPGLPFSVRVLEMVAGGLVTFTVPLLGLTGKLWGVQSGFFISGVAVFLLYLVVAIRVNKAYGDSHAVWRPVLERLSETPSLTAGTDEATS